MQPEAAGYLNDAKGIVAGARPFRFEPTPPDILGPFFKDGAPEYDVTCELAELFDLSLSLTVMDVEGKPIEGATLHVWHADADGEYDNEGFQFRARIKTNQHGKALLNTVRPGHYPISDEEYRCAHVHFKVEAAGHKTLVTQLYFPDDEYNPDDHWFDPRRLISSPYGGFAFVLERE